MKGRMEVKKIKGILYVFIFFLGINKVNAYTEVIEKNNQESSNISQIDIVNQEEKVNIESNIIEEDTKEKINQNTIENKDTNIIVNVPNKVIYKGIQNIDGKEYYFNENGEKQYGFQTINGKIHFFSRIDGAKRKGLFGIDGYNYYFTDEGMQTGLQIIEGNTYLFNTEGKMQYGFQNINGKIHFFSRVNGAQRKGLVGIDGYNYYFTDEGMQTGLQIIEGNTYLFNIEGQMQYGFQTINGKTHFFSRVSGAQRKGLFGIDGYTYYFKEEGMQTGLQHIDGADYFFGQDGKRKSGFQIVNGQKNFFSRIDGKKRYGWIFVDGYSYYLDTNGVPVTGNGLTIDGLVYNFDNEGRMKTGWIERNGYTYYLDNLKNPLTGWQKIAGEKCYFNNRGELIKRGAKLVIDVSSYQGYIDWDTVKRDGLVDGVIIRIGFGSYHYESDAWLKYTISALHRLKIPYGVYLFSYASEAIDGYEEADTMIYAMKKYGMNPTLGIYYDIEEYKNDGHGFTSDWITKDLYDAIITTFMNHMNANGYKAYVYASYSYIMNRFNDHTRSYVGWVAQWGDRCYYNGYYHMWQYSGDAGGNYLYINGINGIVDGNVWFA